MSKQNFNSALSSILSAVAASCLKSGIKIVTAESCTGGGVSYFLTSLPGSSEWYDRGFVTYSNQSKCELLGVKKSTIERHGAVSQEVAIEMSEGALKNSKAQVSLAITGIAGPGGASMHKPVGTCWFGWSNSFYNTHSLVRFFEGNREDVRNQAILFSLGELLAQIKFLQMT